jgi:hypothetical protein
MKNLLVVVSLLFLSLLGLTKSSLAQTTGNSKNLVIVCTPSLAEEDRKVVFNQIGLTVTQSMNAGDKIVVYNGRTVKPIAELTFSPNAKSTKAKFREAGNFMAQVSDFLSHPGEGDKTVLIPQFLDNLGQTSQNSAFQILVIGSPVYKDNNPIYDMSKGWFNDAYLNVDPVNSMFSLKGKSGLIKGSTVYYCYLDDNLFESQNKHAQKAGVKGFWARYMEGLGGRLISFIPDLTDSFKSWSQAFPSKIQYDPLNSTLTQLQIITPEITKVIDPTTTQVVQKVNNTTTAREGSQNTTVHQGSSSGN